jgi:nitric oxide reductase NorQ protein
MARSVSIKAERHEAEEAQAPLAEHLSPLAPGGDVVELRERADLYSDAGLDSIKGRALAYLRSGVPVHLCGPAGTGKTTLALQIATQIGRPAILLAGDGWFTAGHLTGRETGQKTKQVVDRFIHSVKKVESETKAIWSDDLLTRAIIHGYTLVYDEFTRSPPEANNPLLMALEERMLILPGGQRDARYVKAHPEFRAILTSNPSDYAGVAAPQDALIDRMITFDLDEHDRETEIGIVANRSRLAKEHAAPIVDLVRALRRSGLAGQSPSLRSAIMIARIAAHQGMTADGADPAFAALCRDVLFSKAPGGAEPERRRAYAGALDKAIDAIGAAKPSKGRAA